MENAEEQGTLTRIRQFHKYGQTHNAESFFHGMIQAPGGTIGKI